MFVIVVRKLWSLLCYHTVFGYEVFIYVAKLAISIDDYSEKMLKAARNKR